MPDDNQTDNNQTDNNQDNNQQNNDTNTNQPVSNSKNVVIGCDSNNENDSKCQTTVQQVLESAGYQTELLAIDPNAYASYSYGSQAKGKIGVYLMAGSLLSFLDGADNGFDYNIFGIRGDVSDTLGTTAGFQSNGVPKDHHGDCTMPECDKYQGKTYPELNEIYKDRCQAVPGDTIDQLAQNILAAIQGKGFSGGGGQMVNSGGGAQIKDTTFERCIRRICAATDSVFIVDNNVAILFPYTDWLAFTLRQKITTISEKEIDPNIFTTEYNNDGFYNKVSIAWGGATLPERFPDKEDKNTDKNITTNYTAEDIMKNMQKTNFTPKIVTDNTGTNKTATNNKNNKTTTKTISKTDTTVTTKKGETTQTLSVDDTGTSILSEQYDSLVEKYGEMEKRVQSQAPDLETAQYIVNALLIQYVRDFNNACRCRAIANRKYQGGTFYVVTNPYTKETELQFLNGYSMRLLKNEPLYNDLDFRYGPEGAEELSDYQTISGGGGAAGGGSEQISAGSATEEQIWQGTKKACHQWTCENLRVDESDTLDPKVAEDFYNKNVQAGKKFCLTCYGMSSWLYYQFNYKANIPCHVIGNSDHHVVELFKNNQWYKPENEYRKYTEEGYHYNDFCRGNAPVILEAPGGANTVGGNTGGNNK